MKTTAKYLTIFVVAVAIVFAGFSGPQKAAAGDDPVAEYVTRITNIYKELDQNGIIVLTEARNILDSLSDSDWDYILGPFKTAIDEKTSDGTAQAIVHDLADIVYGTDEELESNINKFRENYADEFDKIFGTEITVDTLFNFLLDYEERLESYVLLSFVADYDSITEIMKQAANEAAEANGLDGALADNLGLGVNDILALKDRLNEKVDPDEAARHALIHGLAAYKGVQIYNPPSTMTKGSTKTFEISYELNGSLIHTSDVVEWVSTNTDVASFNDADLTAHSEGTTTVMALLLGLCIDSVDITVTEGSSGGGGGGGATTPTADTGQADEDADNAQNVVNDENASEEEVTNATEQAADSLNEVASNLENEEDAEKLADTAEKVSDTITEAAERVESEEAAVKVTESAVKVAEALAEVAEKASSSEAKEKLADSAANILDAIKKAAEKITSAEKAADVAKTQAAAIKNVKTIVETAENTEAAKKVVDKTSELLDSTAKLVDKVEDAEEAVSIAEEVISSVAELAKSAQSNANVAADINVKQAVRKAQEKAVKVAEKAIEKTGTAKIAEDEVEVEGAKLKAVVNPERVAEKVSAVVQKAQEMEQKLQETALETTKKLEKKVAVEVPAVEGADEVETDIPAGVLDTVAANAIDIVEIKSEVADFGITPGTFGNSARGKDVSMGAKKVTREEIPEPAREQVPENSPVVDLNAKVAGQKVSQFEEPIEVAIPYTLSEGENPDSVTVFLLKDDGTVEPVGGKYDPVTGKVRFTTDHFSKYFAKASLKEFSDLANFAWAETEVEILAGKGIINGKAEGIFDPAADITRAEFAALLTRMLKLTAKDAEMPFTDVPSDSWYREEVAKAYANGIVSGKSATEFDPNGKITRQEMAAMIARVLTRQGYKAADKAELAVFSDKEKVASWAEAAVAMAVREGIVNGMGDGTFAPQANASRAQAAVMLYRLFNK